MKNKILKRILEWVYNTNENLIRKLHRNLEFNTTLLELEKYEYEHFNIGSEEDIAERISAIIKNDIALQKGIALRLRLNELLDKIELA